MALVGTNGQGVGTSPFSEWVKKVSELQLSVDEKQQLDSFIDQVYEDLHAGRTASAGIVRHYLKLWVLNLFLWKVHYRVEAHAIYLGVVNLIRKCFCGRSFQKDLKYNLYQLNPLKTYVCKCKYTNMHRETSLDINFLQAQE